MACGRWRAAGSLLLWAGVALGLGACAGQLPQGEALMVAGRWDEAVAFYLEAVRRDPGDPEARAGLLRSLAEASIYYQRQGDALQRAGKFEEAKARYERALSYNSENSAARTALHRLVRRAKAAEAVERARSLLGKGAFPEAVAAAEAALQLEPDLPEATAVLEEARAALGKAARAGREADPLAAFPLRPIAMQFRDTDIRQVLEVFAQLSGLNILTDDAVGPKRITTAFKDLPLREAFRILLSSNRYFAARVFPNTVVVVPDNPGKRQQYEELFVRTFYLTNADARVAVNLLRTILNTRQVFVNEKLNALAVRDTKEKLDLAGKLLNANDRGGAEVEIELEVLEVDRNRLQDLGIQFSQSLTATLTFPTNQTLQSFQLPNFFNAATLTVSNASLTLNILKNQGNTKILAHPTIRVLDRQKARLLIGERRPFQISQLTSVPATAGTTGQQPVLPSGAVTTTETRVEYRDLGLKLTLTPTIHLDGEVTVEINFEISAVQASTAQTATPIVNTRNVDSFVKVRDGETRLLGGLFQDAEVETIQKIPFLGDLPFVGRLFSNVRTDKDRKDVLVAITPRLVKTVERPRQDVEQFASGTGDAFGPAPLGVPAIPPPRVPPAAPPPGVTPPAPAPPPVGPPPAGRPAPAAPPPR
jgi:general secretion pathway protein D